MYSVQYFDIWKIRELHLLGISRDACRMPRDTIQRVSSLGQKIIACHAVYHSVFEEHDITKGTLG